MLDEFVGGGERVAAYLTFTHGLVSLFVYLETIGVTEVATTDLTQERSVAGVHTVVNLQATFVSVRFIAYVALE